ncbi:MAG: hypothetical protein ACPGUV_04095 [Polyangiales bacterium]
MQTEQDDATDKVGYAQQLIERLRRSRPPHARSDQALAKQLGTHPVTVRRLRAGRRQSVSAALLAELEAQVEALAVGRAALRRARHLATDEALIACQNQATRLRQAVETMGLVAERDAALSAELWSLYQAVQLTAPDPEDARARQRFVRGLRCLLGL